MPPIPVSPVDSETSIGKDLTALTADWDDDEDEDDSDQDVTEFVATPGVVKSKHAFDNDP